MSVSMCVSIYVCVYLCASRCISVYVSVVCICACVCLYTCLYLCIVESVCPCICVCVGASSPPTPTLLGELCPEQGACYGSQRRGREGRGGGEGKGGLALCLSRRENPLSGDPLPPVPCSVPSNHHPDRAPGPLVPAGPTGEIPWASRLLLLKVWPEGFISISWKQRISGPSPAQAPTDSESRIQQDLQVIHLNTKCEKHCPGLPLPCAGGRVVWGLIYRVPQPGYRFPGLC